jgi:two-component system phosphate regulon sensor histidine kinase PhoR
MTMMHKHILALTDPGQAGNAELELSKLEAILTQVQNGMIVVSPDWRVILVNEAARSALGLKEDECSGSPRDVFQQSDLLEIFDEHKTHPSHSEINLDDGRVLSAQTTLIPEVGLVIILHDITYLKELDRIKTDFVNTVSHDLRSPLTAILGYVELIGRAGPVNEQQREFIHRVQFSVNNITALINDLLDLGRVEAGFDTRKEIVQLSAIIHEVVDSMQKRIREKEHHVSLEIPDNLPPLIGNPIRLRQMISNLVNNAIKYTPNQGQISMLCRPEDGQIIFQIKDNGSGILPADQPFVFDKFYRGSNIPHDSIGSGLGLAIVQSIVQNHQGRIWLDSTPGQGTTFTVVLPISDIS